ncbi:phycobilisome linker polypeptide [Leptothoe sp. ISB3NOV94-8A]|uniref:Photosystem I reaction center subunit XII n=1 Tax=Adonisia turfae CCMR0081 TaxID=2292702 RepID=A0A6M0RKB6_9CYAN|nr:phycobilisome linker polypeptide [Adonisia turfae]NEZ56664.1 photosystem I reaction center subunit XII [Adonisia turfae CCMR0081]
MTSAASASSLGFEPFAQVAPIEFRANATETDIKIIIEAAYRQLFGNDHIMRSEHLTSAESLLKQRHIHVRDFVRALALSNLYKHKFFSNNPQVRFIELNFKHFLGRAPYDQTEISEHVNLYIKKGYEAEINSYFDSSEYRDTFGDQIVPYYRGFATQRNQKTVGFVRMFQLYQGYASSDRARTQNKKGCLTTELATNTATPVRTSGFGKELQGITRGKRDKLYRIRVSQSASGRIPQIRRGIQEYLVSYEQLSSTMQRLNQRGSRIINITSA